MKRVIVLIVALVIMFPVTSKFVAAQSVSSILDQIKSEATASHKASVTEAIQEELKNLGYKPGPVDGSWGKKTEDALKQCIKDHSLNIKPVATVDTFQALIDIEKNEKKARVKGIQSSLKDLGYDPGVIDGMWGGKTAAALSKYVKDYSIDIKPKPSDAILKSLKETLAKK